MYNVPAGGRVTALDVFLYALVTALATGIGALPFLFVRRMSRRWLGLCNAVAAGLMAGASAGLLHEGAGYGIPRVMAGVLLGMAFIVASQRLLSQRPALALGTLRGADAIKGLLIVGVMTVHSVAEGVGVGVAFGGGVELGLFITVAIAVHNIPEGLAISLVLVPRGEPVGRAAAWSVFSSLPQPLLALPAFLFVERFAAFLPIGLGFAAGAMLWMVFGELIPEALEDADRTAVAIVVTLSIVAMLVFQALVRP
ncbi:MAG TPA: ZIP family metal transporter [Gemmatimonadota bacterium]|nr:ZIP family metal transporter [Gemmatimonadota bacterium]